MGPGQGRAGRGGEVLVFIHIKCVASTKRSADAGPDIVDPPPLRRQVDAAAADDDAAFAAVAHGNSRRWLTVAAAAAAAAGAGDESWMTLQHLLYVRRDASRS